MLSAARHALLGQFGCCLGRTERAPSIMQNVSVVTAWQPRGAAPASCVEERESGREGGSEKDEKRKKLTGERKSSG